MMQTPISFFKRRIVTDAMWYSVAHACVQLCSLIGVFLIARYLGPINLGLYSFVQNYLTVFTLLMTGIDVYAHWRMIQEPDKDAYVLQYIQYKTYILIPIIFIFSSVSYIVLPEDLTLFVPILCIPLVTSLFASVIFLLQQKNYSRFIASWMCISALIILACKIMAVYAELSLFSFVLINSLDGIILTVACVVIFFTQRNKTKTQIKYLSFFLLLRNAFFAIAYVFVWYVVMRFDQFLVPYYYNAYTLGVYSAAVKVTEMTNVLIVILQTVLLPRMGLVLENQTKQGQVLFVYGGIGIATALCLSIFAPYIISLLYGNEFAEASVLLRVYAWSIPGLFVTYFFTSLYLAKQQYKKLAFITLILSVFVIPTSIFAVKKGVMELAFVSVIFYALTAIVYWIVYKRTV